jgi:hypothetical protein
LVWQKIGAGALMSMAGAGSIFGPAAVAGGAALWADADKKAAQNQENTEAMAQALADGLIMKDENGAWDVKDEEALNALGLTAEQAKAFGEELGENAEELRAYGEAVQ